MKRTNISRYTKNYRTCSTITEVRVSKKVLYKDKIYETKDFLKTYEGEKMNKFIYNLIVKSKIKILS